MTEYDTREGIEHYARTLSGLNELQRARSDAGYGRHERMAEWLVLGRWWTDTCGNFSLASIYSRKKGDLEERLSRLPAVVTKEELFRELPDARMECPMASDLCFRCGRGWSVKDAHDVHVRRGTETVPLKEHVGKLLGEVRREFAARTDAVYFMQPDIQWRNDRLIDLSPLPGYDTLKVNERGWYPPRDEKHLRPEMDDGHLVEEGDDAFFNVQKFFHRVCQQEDLADWHRDHFSDIFRDAGFQGFRLEAVPNGYCPCEVCGPWFRVHTALGAFTVGWRKRVISVEWPDVLRDLLPLFEEEEVTKDARSIHAWGKEKAKDYLRRILGHVAASEVHET